MTREGRAATDWAKAHAHDGGWHRQCLKFVRMSFGLGGGTANAGLAWDNAKYKHRTSDGDSIPPFVPVFWETSGVADHIAISVGGGNCRSTDVVRSGNADIVSINALTRKWGMQLHGWSEDLNGVRIMSPQAKGKHAKEPTPNVTAAIHQNVQYEQALKRITDPAARSAAVPLIKRLREERAVLRAHERK